MLLTALSLMQPQVAPTFTKTARVGNIFARTGAKGGTIAPRVPVAAGCSGYTFGPPGAVFSVDMWSHLNALGPGITTLQGVFPPGTLGNFTFECWIKLFDVSGSPYEAIISFPTPGVAFPGSWQACSAALSALYCMDAFPNVFRSPVLWPPGVPGGDTPLLTLGTWNHLAVVGDLTAQRTRFYINGVARPNGIDELFYTGGFSIAAGPVVIGNMISGSGYWPFNGSVLRGRMSDLRIWSTVRSANDINCAFSHRLVGTEPGLLAYWPMDEGTGVQIHDLTASSNTGAFDGSGAITWVADAPVFT